MLCKIKKIWYFGNHNKNRKMKAGKKLQYKIKNLAFWWGERHREIGKDNFKKLPKTMVKS